MKEKCAVTCAQYLTINKLMLRLVSLFKKCSCWTVERYYHYDHDYHFDSSKFEKAFISKPKA